MADDYEKDDLERVKDWWRTNGLSLVLGAVVGLGAILGWQGWQSYSDNQATAAATVYDQFQQSLAADDPDTERLLALAEQLQSEYGGSPYAARAGLALGDYFVARERYSRAIESLQWVVDYGDQAPLRHIARVRQARLLWAQDEVDRALELLAQKHPPSFAPLYAELEGDIHAVAGNAEQARTAYRRALDNLPPDTDPTFLQRKLDDVDGPVAARDDAQGNSAPEVS